MVELAGLPRPPPVTVSHCSSLVLRFTQAARASAQLASQPGSSQSFYFSNLNMERGEADPAIFITSQSPGHDDKSCRWELSSLHLIINPFSGGRVDKIKGGVRLVFFHAHTPQISASIEANDLETSPLPPHPVH